MLPKNLTLVKFDKVDIRVPYFDPNPHKSKTKNHKWRKGLFILFKDQSGKEFIWMPKWSEIHMIQEGKDSIELVNKKLCNEHSKEEN